MNGKKFEKPESVTNSESKLVSNRHESSEVLVMSSNRSLGLKFRLFLSHGTL